MMLIVVIALVLVVTVSGNGNGGDGNEMVVMATRFLVLVVAVVFIVTVSVVIVTLPPRQVMKLSFSEDPGLSPSISLSASDHLLILETLDKPESPLSTLDC